MLVSDQVQRGKEVSQFTEQPDATTNYFILPCDDQERTSGTTRASNPNKEQEKENKTTTLHL